MKKTALQVKWAEVKVFLDSRKIIAQYIDLGESYLIMGLDGPIQIFCYVHKETPASDDQIDFETNYKTSANVTYSDADGAALGRTKVTQSGWQYHLQGLEFTTADRDSVVNKDENGNDLGFATMKLYDANGDEVTTELGESSAVKTVIDWEPTFDYEILGGTIRSAANIVEDIYAYVIAVPDIPKAFGGSKDFICCLNLKFIGANDKIEADGRAAKKMIYDAVNHTNKIRVVLTHPAGIKRSLSLVLELFKP